MSGYDPKEAPRLPGASPIGELQCPLGNGMSPCLTTPMWGHAGREDVSPIPVSPISAPALTSGTMAGFAGFSGLSGIDQWAWEMGSEASRPSAWSKPSTLHSSVSRISNATGDGLIPGLVDGQRLSTVKPSSVSSKKGGKVVVTMRKEVPQGYWNEVGILLVNGPLQEKLKPEGIKKGKKLCVQVPAGLEPGDYDVRLCFKDKVIHGAIPLSVRDGDDEAIISEEED